jgi:hypothetical protein
MIGQYLSNTNESATIPILQNFLEVNNALLLLYQYYINFLPVALLKEKPHVNFQLCGEEIVRADETVAMNKETVLQEPQMQVKQIPYYHASTRSKCLLITTPRSSRVCK